MEVLELKDFTIKQGSIDSSQFERISEYALDIKNKYQDLTLTDDNLSELKDVHARLNKLINALETERKRVKKLWSKPYEEFEASYKDAIKPINEVKALINSQITDFETNKKNEHINNIDMWFEKEARNMAPNLYEFISAHPAVKYRVLKPEHYNLSYAPTKRENEVRQALREVMTTLDQIAGDVELLDIYAEIGSYIDALRIRKERRDRIKELSNNVASATPQNNAEKIDAIDKATDAFQGQKIIYLLDDPTTADDLKPAALSRRFKGPKYKLLALINIATMLGIECEKIN